jgi:predicted aspartyl protease
MMRLVVLAMAALLYSSLLAQAEPQNDWPADCKLEPVAELPMRLISGHVTVPGSVNGKDATLGIDTGGPYSSFTKAAIPRLGLEESVGGVRFESLQVGGLALGRTEVSVMESFPGVDGLIAPDILGKYDAEFDFGDNRFYLFKHHPCVNRAVHWTDTYTVIPFTLSGDGHVRLPVTLDGKNTVAILDTGSPISVLSMQDASTMFGLTPDSANIKAANSVSGPWSSRLFFVVGRSDVPKTVNAYTYPFKTLILGGVTVPNPPIELIQARNFLGRDYAVMLIGNDLLSRFRIYIAYQEQKLYITDAHAN